MLRNACVMAIIFIVGQNVWAQPSAQTRDNPGAAAEQEIRERLQAYIDTFNRREGAEVASYWAADAVSVAQETGERTEGRDALQREFATFFAANPTARLTGDVTSIRAIRPDVVELEGRTTLYVANAEPVASAFTAILVKQNDQWLISSSHEHDLASPENPSEALKELEWLVGTWEDQTEGAAVSTTVRWSPNRAFLIRSFTAEFDDEVLQGTQVIGWDPLSKQIRTWTFYSDGSFGQGTVSRHDEEWMWKMRQVLPDGRLAAGTKVMTRVDDDTMTVRAIGETVDGEPRPSSEPVTAVRTADAEAVSPRDGATRAEGETP